MWQLLWPLVTAAQPPELALDPVRLTSDPPAPTEPWILHSDLPPASPHVLTTPADPGSFRFQGSSTAAQMVTSPQELTEPLVPFPDAAAELPPRPDQLAAGLQDPEDKQALAQPSERPEEDEASSLQIQALTPSGLAGLFQASPSPRHLEVTLPHPEQVQSQHPNPTEVTVQPVDLDATETQQPESSETLPATTEQSASRNIDICKLCTCTDGTLSCVGLNPEQRLRRVPELKSHSYNGTFTIV